MGLIKNTTAVQPPPIQGMEIRAEAPPAVKAKMHLSKEEYWDRKEERDIERDKRMSRAGLYQAALQSPALMQYSPTLEDYWALVRKTAELGLEFVNDKAGK